MTMRAVAFVLAMIPTASMAAGPYLEIGLGHAQGIPVDAGPPAKQYESSPTERGGVGGPFAIVEAGYGLATWRGETSVSAMHISSVASGRDAGVNFIGVTHRFGGRR